MSPVDATSQSLYDPQLWQKRNVTKVDGVWKVEGKPRMIYQVLRIEQPANIPGKSFVAALVTAPPGSITPPHTHNGAAVFAEVIKGRVISQMIHHSSTEATSNTVQAEIHDSGVNVYRSGEMWYEAPGCHHVRNENASDEEEAQLFVNFIIDTHKLNAVNDPAAALTLLDADVQPFNTTSTV